METVSLIGRLLVSLGAVLGVIWLISRRMRKTGRGKASGLIEVLDRRQLSRSSAVAVVRVGDQALVIGVTDHQVSVLGEADPAVAVAAKQAAADAPRPRSASPRPANRQRGARRPVAAVSTGKSPKPTAPVAAAATVADTQTAAQTATPAQRGALAGSALSPQTWKQTIESLREMTVR